METIKDKVAIVTGASSGIGYGIARELAKAGAVTMLAARSADKLEALAGGRRASAPAWLMSHPRTPDRIAAIERLEQRWGTH